MKSTKIDILAFEWSESPFHQGVYSVILSYHSSSGRWALSASQSPSGERLSWKTGDGTEDPKEIAIQLLRKSYDRGALTFDLIADEGPFGISIKDFVPPKTRMVDTNESTEPSRRICQYCRYLKRPQGIAAMRAGSFDCGLGNWTDQVRWFSDKDSYGRRLPNLEFTCDEFKPEFKQREETYY